MLVLLGDVRYNRENTMQQLCKDCVNYLVDENTMKTECDYGFFQNVDLYKSYLFLAEDFDCDEWETLKE